MATPAAAAVPRLRSWRWPGPLGESVALVPICQTRRPSAKTLRCGAELAELGLTRQDIDLTGLGLVLPEQVPRTILVGRRTVRPARGLENGLVRFDRQQVNISFERYYLRSAADTRFVASVGWWALFRTETAYWPRLLSGSTFGTTTVRWKASQFSRDS